MGLRMEQVKLLELMQEMKEIARAQQNVFTKEEVKKYLGEEAFDEKTLKAIYQYLGENHIQVEGYEYVPVVEITETEEEASKTETEEGVKQHATDRGEENLLLYEEEVGQIKGEIEDDALIAFLNGEKRCDSISAGIRVKDYIIERYLKRVIELSKNYKKHSVSVDEIIAEGNIGLLMAMNKIEESANDYWVEKNVPDRAKFFGVLEMEVKQSMERYIDEMVSSKDWEHTVLAKTNLLHEATKYLTEEIGKVPTIDELAEYTKIPKEEIKDIMDLSEDAKRVADLK